VARLGAFGVGAGHRGPFAGGTMTLFPATGVPSCCCQTRRPERDGADNVAAQSGTNSSSSAISSEKMPSASVTAKPKIRLAELALGCGTGLRTAAAR